MFVLERISHDPYVMKYEIKKDLPSRLGRTIRGARIARAKSRYLATAPAGLSFFTDDRTVYGKAPWQQIPDSDLIQLQWVSGFLDYRAFFKTLPSGKPVVWTLHGMDAITGGCFYDNGCGRFTKECGICPQLGSESASDLTHQVWRRKRESYSRMEDTQLRLVAPSRWLQAEVKRSSLMSAFSCEVIPNGLDTDVFAPRNRAVARDVVGVPPDAKAILFIADGIGDPRKGFALLREALAGMESDRKLFLVSVGPGYPPNLQGFPHAHFEPVNNDRLLSYVYSAADVVVVPSLQDNLPNTILESLACGTPVVGFDVGGIPDLVRPWVSGMLAKPADSFDLQRAIAEVLNAGERLQEMAANCRRIAVTEYALEVQARRYLDLYRDAVDRRTDSR
jgi:glycosyltransferase involved in cell wall biosynthesis